VVLRSVNALEIFAQYALAKNARSVAGSPHTMHLPAAPSETSLEIDDLRYGIPAYSTPTRATYLYQPPNSAIGWACKFFPLELGSMRRPELTPTPLDLQSRMAHRIT
jgi:hypothetical protein